MLQGIWDWIKNVYRAEVVREQTIEVALPPEFVRAYAENYHAVRSMDVALRAHEKRHKRRKARGRKDNRNV